MHEHQKEEHNMWHYVWFKLYLEFKDPLTYSYTEYLAANAIDNAGVSIYLTIFSTTGL